MSILSRIRKALLSRNLNDEIGLIRTQYGFQMKKEEVPALVIFCLDSRSSKVGFADRLRGMVSCFAYAKAIGVPFRIEHLSPFDLTDYLVPDRYDWRLKDGEKSYNLRYSNPVFMIQRTVGKRSMRLFRLNQRRQHHIYTNANYLKEVNRKYRTSFQFHELFHELFKPSCKLEDALSKHRDQLMAQEGYISVSFRFMQLMGDFKDCRGEILPDDEKADLLTRSLSVIGELHDKERKTILVTSDSQTFLDKASALDFVYIVPGKTGHIGFSQGQDVHDKMFLDFFLISQARHVYMAFSGKMYRSIFAKTAAWTNNVPYDEIAF